MPALVVQLADALVTAIKAHDFGAQFQAKRSYRPEYTITQLDTTRVTVVPGPEEQELATRGPMEDVSVQLDLAVQRHLTAAADDVNAEDHERDQIDALMEFVETLANWVRTDPHADHCESLLVWVATTRTAPLVREDLEKHRVFTAALVLTFKTVR